MSSMRLDVARGGLPPFIPANIRGYGHSIAAGGNATRIGTTDFYPRTRSNLDPALYTLTYVGHPGQWTAQMLPQAAADVDAFYDPNKINIFLYIEVINSVSHYMVDLGMTATAAAPLIIADHLSMFSGRKTTGFQICLAYTMYHPFGFNAQQMLCVDLINQGLRDAVGGGVLDGIIDIAVDSRFAVTGPPGTSLTVDDNTHPTDFGHQIMADIGTPIIQAKYEALGGVAHPYLPSSIGQLLWWYEADPAFVTFDGSNRISLVKDRSGWVYDLSAAGAARPTWNSSNILYGSKPTIDTVNNCMTTALNVNMSFTKSFEVVWLFQCTNANAIIMELSSNSSSFADTFLAQFHNATTGPEITTYGNVTNSIARATGPTTVKMVSFSVDNTVSTNQCNLLSEGATAPGITHIDAPNTNFFGNRPLNLFARNGVVAGGTMSTGICIAFSKILSPTERAGLLAYAMAKWPH